MQLVKSTMKILISMILLLICFPGFSQEAPKNPGLINKNEEVKYSCDRVEEFCKANGMIEYAIFSKKYVEAGILINKNKGWIEIFNKNPKDYDLAIQAARFLQNNGLFNVGSQEYPEAKKSYLKALAILKPLGASKQKSRIDASIQKSIILTNLGNLYERIGEDKEAEKSYLESIRLSLSKMNLGRVNHIYGFYSIAHRENKLPDMARCLKEPQLIDPKQGIYIGIYNQKFIYASKSLARLYESRGDNTSEIGKNSSYQNAAAHYVNALGNQFQSCEIDSASIMELRNDLSRFFAKQGNTEYLLLASGSPLLEHINLTLLFFGTPFTALGRETILFKTPTGGGYVDLSESTFPFISHAVKMPATDAQAAQLALNKILLYKGVATNIESAGLRNCQTLKSSLTMQDKCQELDKIVADLSVLTYKQSTANSHWQTNLKELISRREKIEKQIGFENSKSIAELNPNYVNTNIIQNEISIDSAFIEIVKYRPPKLKHGYRDWWDDWHYAVAVLRSTGAPQWIDLGKADAIDTSVQEFRTVLANRGEISKIARKLDQQVMEKIRPLLGNAKHLLISADGQLNLIPFEALQDETGQYLIKRDYQFSYLTSGRDLIQMAESRKNPYKSRQDTVIVADPDYYAFNTQVAKAPATLPITSRKPTLSSNLSSTSSDTSVDTLTDNLGPAPGTQELATTLKSQIFPTATILSREKATKTALKQLSNPRILLLGTHGFFLSDSQKELPFDEKIVGKNNLQKSQPSTMNIDNPLLLSGLALAGFNQRNHKELPLDADNGVLTALEVTGLDLSGTQLVVLSACETGLGEPKIGDGVHGLRRALAIAGSETQVLSLWKVDGEATKDLMVNYFGKLSPKVGQGMGRHEALQAAKQELMKNPKYQHPYYWASFIPSGDWTPLH